MPEVSFPFDSVQTDGIDDRVYYSEDFKRYFKQFLTNGVYPNPSTNLKVEALNNNMVLSVNLGSAFINGACYSIIEDKLNITVSDSHISYNRKDIVVVSLNETNRTVNVLYKEGVPSASPQAPTITRNADIYELKLCEITVKSGVNKITQADILDTRLDKSVCGLVTGLVETVDTTELFNQYETYLNQKIEEWKKIQQQQGNEFNNQMTEIENWYTEVKVDITKLQSFDFDNLAELKGTTKNTKFLSNGNIEEKIFITADNTKVADRLTTFLSNGDIQVDTKVYERNGVDIMKQVSVITKFNSDGSISEVIS